MKALFFLFLFGVMANTLFAQGFSKAEYFIDTDPGVGNGIAIVASNGNDTINFATMVPTTSLAAGFHTLGLRVQHSSGLWGLFEKRGFYVSGSIANAPDIVSAEYFFDADPGPGNGTPASVGTSGGVVNFTAVIPASLSPGFHFLAIRTRDAAGAWGMFEKRGFYVSGSAADAPDIVSAEYFFDADPGPGNGTPASVGATGGVVNFTAVIPASLSPGFHFLAIRTRDAAGAWGMFEKRGFYVSGSAADAPDIVSAEYFFDADPGPGNGTPASVGATGGVVNFTAVIPTSLSPGFHFLAIRTRDAAGAWGLFEKRGFYVSITAADMPVITNAEYFFDIDPGVGNGTALTMNTPGNIVHPTFTIPVPGGFTEGEHILAIRVQDQNGNWGLYAFQTFDVGSPTPVTGLQFFAVPDRQQVHLKWYSLTELNTQSYEIERGKDGVRFMNIGSVDAVGNSNSRTDYNFTDDHPVEGTNYYRLKQTDKDGGFMYSEIRAANIESKGEIIVYPTLTKGLINIQGLDRPSVIKIFNSNGQMMEAFEVGQNQESIRLNNASKGMYLLTIEQEGRWIYSCKIMKQ